MAAQPIILSHWHKLLGNLEASPMEFYGSVESAIERRAVPDTLQTRVEHHEGGVVSAKREYLRIRRGRHIFDICAAPFGTGFFVSWWFGELRAGPLKLALVALGLFTATVLAFRVAGFLVGAQFFLFGIPLIVWVLIRHTPEELAGWDDPLRSIPVLGPLYERWFRPETYYTVDTYLMFQSAVHSAVLEVVDGLTVDNGLRALSDLERKPINRELIAG